MNVDRDAIGSSLGRDRIETISKVMLAIMSLLFVAALARAVPGTEHLVPVTSVGGEHLVVALTSLLIVGLLVYLSSALGRLLSMILSGPPRLVESVASIVRWGVLLAAVIVGHAGLTPLVDATLGDAAWTLDIAALLVALPILLVIALRLYVALDPAARYLAETVTDTGA